MRAGKWVVLLGLLAASLHVTQSQPFCSQVHISLTLSPDEMAVTWSTPEPADSIVRFAEARYFPHQIQQVAGYWEQFVDNGTLHHTQYIHRATLTGLKPLTHYVYQIWNATEYSTLFHFTSAGGSDWAPKFTVFGDFGLINARSLPHLIEETHAGASDIIVHVGDFAYDMYVDNATFGDVWFNSIQELAANQPYMVCPGNHEGMYDFLNYRSRFTMPYRNQTENLYFSWDAGLTHWISYDTEVYFVYDAMDGHGGIHRNFGPYPEIAKAQVAFIEADLMRANANRHNQPWIIAYGHRPMYCSDDDDDDCIQMRNLWKNDLEPLFYKYGVDLVIEAHQHSYERLWPVFNGTVLNGSVEAPYTNARAPVHIVSGSAGCQENLDTFGPPLGPWSALRVSDYGYAHLTVHNTTHMHWEQIRSDAYEVVDEIWIVKDSALPVFATHRPDEQPVHQKMDTQDNMTHEHETTHDDTHSVSKAVVSHDTSESHIQVDKTDKDTSSKSLISGSLVDQLENEVKDRMGHGGFVVYVFGACTTLTIIGFVVYWSKWVMGQRRCAPDDRGMYHRI